MSMDNINNDNAGINTAMSTFSKMLSTVDTANYFNDLKRISSYEIGNKEIERIIGDQFTTIKSTALSVSEQLLVKEAMKVQCETLCTIRQAYITPEIENLRKALVNCNASGYSDFVKAINTNYIEAANVAIIKSTKAFDTYHNWFPRGLVTALKELNMGTAKALSKVDNISLDLSEKAFYLEDEPNERISVSESNVVFSSLDLFSDITEDELIKLLNVLSAYPNLVLDNPTAQKIKNILEQWDNILDFDYPFFYHARELPEDTCPYTESDLLKAPRGIVGHGRFNNVGKSCYYFSNNPIGAIREVCKHNKKASQIQIAKLKPKRQIKLIDLSLKTQKSNKLLDYCRFSPQETNTSKIKREYLLPCFIAQCCESVGIEGIKYYGSKEYMNYVSWDDSFFELIDYGICKKMVINGSVRMRNLGTYNKQVKSI